jgi:ribosome-associated protein
MLRTSHGAPGAPRPKAKGAAERPARPAPGAARPKARAAAARKAPVVATERPEEDSSRLKKTKVPGATSTASDDSREVAILIAVAGIEKKASGLEVIDVAGRVDYADFLVLMSGRSDRHVTALASAIEESLRKRNKRALAVEGLPHANWVLMDFGDVVVHVFQDDARSAYDIDALWMDARRVPVPLSEATD